MNVLVYFASGDLCDSVNGRHVDLAIDELSKGNHVVALICDEKLGPCMHNPLHSKLYCRFCKLAAKRDLHNLMPKDNVEYLNLGKLIDEVSSEPLPHFKYRDAEELRSLEYDNVQLGFGVMSTYISLTRNMDPKITPETKAYFDSLIKEQILTLRVLKLLQKKYHFGLVVFQNGRGAQLKPFLNYCQAEKIDFWCTEDFSTEQNCINNFWNDYAHSLYAYDKKFEECWEKSQDTSEKREEIARSFFENRRNAKAAGDKIYVKDQIKGLMPKDWDSSKENIVIFNSSEDEFCAVGNEWEKLKIFKSQMDGIIALAEHYKNDTTKHFTLRVHPNLKDLPYKYHQNLYKLNYPNLTVIPGWDPISSYSLLDAADKVAVFGSTMGVEASYWKKPVICLGPSFYHSFGITYNPKSLDEVWQLIDTKDLQPLYNEKALWYGYYYMTDLHDKTKYINVDYLIKPFMGKTIKCCKYKKILGSTFLYGFIMKFLGSSWMKKRKAEFSHISCEEA